MSNKISLSGSLSHIMKVLTFQRCKVALPSEDIADPSAVFRCTTAGNILVLYQFSIMSYKLVQTRERAAPKSIRALNLLPVCTVTIGQSDTSPIV